MTTGEEEEGTSGLSAPEVNICFMKRTGGEGKEERETFRLENGGVHFELGEDREVDVLQNDVRNVQDGEGKGHFGADRVGTDEGRRTLRREERKRKRICSEKAERKTY